MAYAFVTGAHAIAAGKNSATTTGINTTGADLVVVISSWETDAGGPATLVITDNKSNGNATSVGPTTGTFRTNISYWHNPTVGSGHTFSFSATSAFACIAVLCFSGSAATPLDQSNGATVSNAATIQAGSITPTQDNELVIVSWCGAGTTNTLTIDGSFTKTDFLTWVTGANDGGGAAYLIQTTATAANPTWTADTSTGQAAKIASFKAAATGKLFVPTSLNGLGAGGPFFHDRLAS